MELGLVYPQQPVLGHDSPLLGAPIPECDGLLRWQVNNNEAVDSSFSTIFQESLLSIAKHRVVVTHEQDRSSQAPFPCCPDHVKCRGDRDSVFESLLCNCQSATLSHYGKMLLLYWPSE
jgi:hypothetical protein